MKQIEVTDEMYEFLMDLSNELNTQEHRCTAMPYIFQIQTQEQVPATDGCGTEAWCYDGSIIETEKEISEAIADYKGFEVENVPTDNEEREEILMEAGWFKVNYEMKEKLQNAFLTSKACDEHIRLNSYHYNKPVNYLSHSFRNPELEKLITFVCELTGGKIHK